MSQPLQRHHGLDATRGICALVVAAYHFLATMHVAVYPSMGIYAVYVFFILSSVTLCLVYSDRFRRRIELNDLTTYAVARAARILPLLTVVAIASFVGVWHWQGLSLQAFVQFFFTATGAFAFGPPGALSNSMGAWSLGIEILFYLVFPVLCLTLLRLRLRTLLAVSAVALVFQYGYVSFTVIGHTFEDAWGNYISPASFLFYFTAGFAVYKAKRNIRWGFPAGLVLIATGTLVSLITPIARETLLLSPVTGFGIPLLLATGVYFICCGATASRWIRAFEFLGAISYSSYLLHPFVLVGTSYVLGRYHLPLAVIAAIYCAGTITISYASYRLFEGPMRQWLRRVDFVRTAPAN